MNQTSAPHGLVLTDDQKADTLKEHFFTGKHLGSDTFDKTLQ
jgi:hypothetical protein